MSSRDYQSSNNRENQLFIGRLPRNVSEKTVEDKFGQYGKMVRCDVKQGTKVAYAFVQYEDKKDAEDAMEQENGAEVDGEVIVIEWSRDSRGESRGRGGYRGGRYSRGGGGGGRFRDDGGYRGRDSGGDYRSSSYRRDDYSRDDYGSSRGRNYYDDDHHYNSGSGYRSRSQERR